MNIIAHRGYWKNISQKNTLQAFESALRRGYGVETDIRDYKGELVISHDIASRSCIRLAEFFEIYKSIGCESVLALNIKADGICNLLHRMLMEHEIKNYFVFDMSVPEMVLYKDINCKYCSRQSDIEPACVLYQNAVGVWIDAFYSYDWINPDILKRHILEGKDVVVVSPELHGMNNESLWNVLKSSGLFYDKKFFICTDIPDVAKSYLEVS